MSDTAEYSAVATNQHGTATSKAKVTVKSKSFSHFASLSSRHGSACVSHRHHGFSLSSQDQQEPDGVRHRGYPTHPPAVTGHDG